MAPRPTKSYAERHPGRFIKAALFRGEKRTLTITEMITDEVEGDVTETEVMAGFKETERKWIVNYTNGCCLIAMFGEDAQLAVGHRVTLYPTRTKLGHDDVDAIRVWGSPDIERDMVVEVKLPRRKTAQKITLHAVRDAKPAPTREPGDD